MPIDKEKIRAMIRAKSGIKVGGPCPVCETVNLETIEVEGVEQDFCSQCNGIWLDKGEAAEIAEGVQDFPDFDWSWANKKISKKKSPRFPDQFMWELPYIQGKNLKIDYCEASGGMWLDCSEIAELEIIVADNTDPNMRLHKMAADLKKSGYICV